MQYTLGLGSRYWGKTALKFQTGEGHQRERERERGEGGGETETDRQTDRQSQRERHRERRRRHTHARMYACMHTHTHKKRNYIYNKHASKQQPFTITKQQKGADKLFAVIFLGLHPSPPVHRSGTCHHASTKAQLSQPSLSCKQLINLLPPQSETAEESDSSANSVHMFHHCMTTPQKLVNKQKTNKQLFIKTIQKVLTHCTYEITMLDIYIYIFNLKARAHVESGHLCYLNNI